MNKICILSLLIIFSVQTVHAIDWRFWRRKNINKDTDIIQTKDTRIAEEKRENKKNKPLSMNKWLSIMGYKYSEKKYRQAEYDEYVLKHNEELEYSNLTYDYERSKKESELEYRERQNTAQKRARVIVSEWRTGLKKIGITINGAYFIIKDGYYFKENKLHYQVCKIDVATQKSKYWNEWTCDLAEVTRFSGTDVLLVSGALLIPETVIRNDDEYLSHSYFKFSLKK